MLLSGLAKKTAREKHSSLFCATGVTLNQIFIISTLALTVGQNDRQTNVYAQRQPQLRSLLPRVLPLGGVQLAPEAKDARSLRHSFRAFFFRYRIRLNNCSISHLVYKNVVVNVYFYTWGLIVEYSITTLNTMALIIMTHIVQMPCIMKLSIMTLIILKLCKLQTL